MARSLGGARGAGRQGYTFMLTYVPSDLDTTRAMAVVRRFDYGLAHKFDRFAVQVL